MLTITTPEQMREAAALAVIRIGLEIGVTGVPVVMLAAVNAIRAIPIAPQPAAVTVKPLVWRGSYGCLIAKGAGVEYYAFTKGWNTSLDGTTHPAESREDAKAACQAHHDALLRAELTIHPADPLSDPRVVALVEAATDLLEIRAVWTDPHNDSDVKRARAALRAIGGEA